MVKYIKAKAPTRRQIRVAEREAKRAMRIGPSGLRSPRPKSPTFSRSSSRGSLNELDGNLPSVFIVRSPSPGGSPKLRSPWSRSDSPPHHTEKRPTENLSLMNSCIQVCNENLEQMKLVNQRLQQLRGRPPSPSAGTSLNLKRRSQLLHKRHGGASPPLSPSPSLRLIQTGSVILDGKCETSVASSEEQESVLSAAASQATSDSVSGDPSKVGTHIPNIISESAANSQQPPITSLGVSGSKLIGPGGSADTTHNSTSRPQRLNPPRQLSSGSLSSNAATMRLPCNKPTVSAGAVNMNSTKRPSSVASDCYGTGGPRLRERSRTSTAVDDLTFQGNRAPPPTRTVAGSRVVAPRPVPARSSSSSRFDGPSRPGSASTSVGFIRSKISAVEAKNGIGPRAKLPDSGSDSGPSRALESAATTKPISNIASRSSSSTLIKTVGSSGKGSVACKSSPVPSNASANSDSRVSLKRSYEGPLRPPTSKEVQLPSGRTRSVSGPLRPTSGSTSRVSTPSGPPAKSFAAGDRLRMKTSPQVVIHPARDDGLRHRSGLTSGAPPKTDISASRTSLLDTMETSENAESPSPSVLRGARKASTTPNTGAIGQRGEEPRRSTRPSGGAPQRSESPVKTSIVNSRFVSARSNTKAASKVTDTAATEPTSGAQSRSVSSRPLRTLLLDRNVNTSGSPNAVPRPSARRRASRPYHAQSRDPLNTTSAAPPSCVTRREGQTSRATSKLAAKVPSAASSLGDGAKVSARLHAENAFNIAEIKACLFGHTASTGPPRPYTAALRYWLEMLPGVSGIFSTKGSSVFMNVDATPQVFAVRKAKGIPHVSRRTIVAFLRSRPVSQPTLALPQMFPQGARSPILAAVASVARSPVQTKQMPKAVEDIFLPGSPFTETGEEAMRMPPLGVQKPRQESLRRALSRLSRFGTPTRAPSLTRPLVGGSEMDAYLAAVEAQTFDLQGGLRHNVGGLGRGTHARRALVRMVKTVCRTTCRNATKLLLRPWRLLLRLLLRQ